MSLPASHWLAARARGSPERPALISPEATLSYRELERRAWRLAAKLRAIGIGHGSRVAMLHANHPLYVELIHALVLLEATLVPLNTRLTADELGGLLDHVRPDLLIHAPEFAATLAELGVAQLPLRTLETPRIVALPEKPAPLRAPRPELEQAILFTSGTTGRAKGVRLTLANHAASARGSARRLATTSEDRWLACVPLYHIAGLAIVLRCALDGMCLVLHPRFDAARVAETLQRQAVTAVSLVPTMLEALLERAAGSELPGALRFVLLGGGPIPATLIQRALKAGIPLAPTYGLTEAASQVTTLAPHELAEHAGTVGRPLAGVDVRVVDASGRPQRPDRPGEIQVRGAQVMSGYLDRPAASAEALRDGWLNTGDYGALDAQGYLTLLDRRGDLIVSGGENVYPAEVEGVLCGHPGVADAAVVGRPDPRWGHVVHAFIVAVGKPPAAEELAAHCRGKLAGFKVPREFHFVARLPRTPSGELRREALR